MFTYGTILIDNLYGTNRITSNLLNLETVKTKKQTKGNEVSNLVFRE